VGTVVAVGRGPRIFLVGVPGEMLVGIPWDADPERAADRRAELRPEDVPDALVHRLDLLPSGTRLTAAGPLLSGSLGHRAGGPVELASVGLLRRARASLPPLPPETERTFLRSVAARRLNRALRSPAEVVITLAREEERVERALGREERAAESFVTVPDSPLETYVRDWTSARGSLAMHHARLLASLEHEVRSVLPNLSRVVGPRVAARLLAASGGLGTLGRMSAPRLQLLGSRRRPSAERGPRFGVLYRAERMEEVPLGRRGAYARSLAALAAIAARADASTGRDISRPLVERRDRRVAELQRRRR